MKTINKTMVKGGKIYDAIANASIKECYGIEKAVLALWRDKVISDYHREMVMAMISARLSDLGV